MAHPMAGQAKASEKSRLARLTGKPGKAWGSSQMYKKTSYPKKQAGSSTPMTISGGKSRKRPDRFAGGGAVKSKSKAKPHHTTNIVISAPGGAGGRGLGTPGVGRAMPVPINRPVPVPVRPPIGVAPPVAPPVAGALPPVAPVARPPIAPVRPPIMPGAGVGMKRGGAVKKAANGGTAGGRAYRGFPNSPTTAVDSAVSAHRAGGRVAKHQIGGPVTKKKQPGDNDDQDDSAQMIAGAAPPMAGPPPDQPAQVKRGGGVKKRQLGGLLGQANPATQPMPAQQGPRTISGRKARPAQPLLVPPPRNVAAQMRVRPAPGTTVGFKKGGKAHADEAQDRQLIKKMLKQEDKREKT